MHIGPRHDHASMAMCAMCPPLFDTDDTQRKAPGTACLVLVSHDFVN